MWNVWSRVFDKCSPFFEQLLALRLVFPFVEVVIDIGAGLSFWKLLAVPPAVWPAIAAS